MNTLLLLAVLCAQPVNASAMPLTDKELTGDWVIDKIVDDDGIQNKAGFVSLRRHPGQLGVNFVRNGKIMRTMFKEMERPAECKGCLFFYEDKGSICWSRFDRLDLDRGGRDRIALTVAKDIGGISARLDDITSVEAYMILRRSDDPVSDLFRFLKECPHKVKKGLKKLPPMPSAGPGGESWNE